MSEKRILVKPAPGETKEEFTARVRALLLGEPPEPEED